MAQFCDSVNLTKINDKILSKIIEKLTETSEVKAQYEHLLKFSQNFGNRKMVHLCSVAVSAWECVNTVTTHTMPSPESLAWSNLEGGHTFHQTPSFKSWLEENFGM